MQCVALYVPFFSGIPVKQSVLSVTLWDLWKGSSQSVLLWLNDSHWKQLIASLFWIKTDY